MELKEQLDRIFSPRTIAVVGASTAPEKVGYVCIANLLQAGFGGRIYPVNPGISGVLGLPAYPAVGSIADEIDLAIIAVPAGLVVPAVEDCAARGVTGAIVISSGFREVGTRSGREQQARLGEIAGNRGLRIIGPNTMGIVNPRANLVASFQYTLALARAGGVAVATQSGGLCIHIVHSLTNHNVGISKAIGMGNRCDLDFDEIVTYFLQDSETRVIALYIEGLEQPRRLMRVAGDGARHKPIVVLKGGRGDESRRATLSHTGALSGRYEVYRAAFRQSGMLDAGSATELVDITKALSLQPPAAGDRVAVVCIQAGLGIVTADRCRELGLRLARFAPATRRRLRRLISALNAVDNPVDVAWQSNEYDTSGDILSTILGDDGVDAVIVAAIFWPPNMELMKATAAVARRHGKPVTICLDSPRGMADGYLTELEKSGIPAYPTPERAASGLAGLVRYGQILAMK